VDQRIQSRWPAPLAAAQAVALVGRERLAAGRARLARGSEHRSVKVDGGHGGGPARGAGADILAALSALPCEGLVTGP
jgi:hypothetical protein